MIALDVINSFDQLWRNHTTRNGSSKPKTEKLTYICIVCMHRSASSKMPLLSSNWHSHPNLDENIECKIWMGRSTYQLHLEKLSRHRHHRLGMSESHHLQPELILLKYARFYHLVKTLLLIIVSVWIAWFGKLTQNVTIFYRLDLSGLQTWTVNLRRGTHDWGSYTITSLLSPHWVQLDAAPECLNKSLPTTAAPRSAKSVAEGDSSTGALYDWVLEGEEQEQENGMEVGKTLA